MKYASPKDLHHLFGTYPEPDTTKAMKAFHIAARKVAGMIAKAAHGEYESHDEKMKLFAAINKLDDRANKAEIRGDDNAREKAWAEVSHLRASVRPALDEGERVRREYREGESARIKEEMRQEWANLDPYQRELRMRAAKRDPMKPQTHGRSQKEYLAHLDWNIKDAKEALANAVGMGDWKGTKKYTAQLEALEAKRWKHSTKRTTRGYGIPSENIAGQRFGYGELPGGNRSVRYIIEGQHGEALYDSKHKRHHVYFSKKMAEHHFAKHIAAHGREHHPRIAVRDPSSHHGWGRRLDKWHDEKGPFHLLTASNAPACGASFYSMTGAHPHVTEHQKCKRCLAITRKK